MAKPKRDSLPHYEHLIFYVKLAAALIVVCISALTAAYMRNRNPNGWVAQQRQPMWSPKLDTTLKDNKPAHQKFAYAIQVGPRGVCPFRVVHAHTPFGSPMVRLLPQCSQSSMLSDPSVGEFSPFTFIHPTLNLAVCLAHAIVRWPCLPHLHCSGSGE